MGNEKAPKTSSDSLRENFERVLPTLKGVTLLPVTKTVEISRIKQAKKILEDLKLQVIFGENYAQELLIKKKEISEAEFHFIGVLQSNKIKSLLEFGVFIQSIGSKKHLEIAKKIALERTLTTKVFLQVNVSEDPKKAGVNIDEAKKLLEQDFTPIKISGLMTILEDTWDEKVIRNNYRKLAKLGEGKLELSMGMSHDYKIAIEEGATMVRLGSILFGSRN